ncbi:MAG: HAMP domain-containing protein [Alistipes senegalensis]
MVADDRLRTLRFTGHHFPDSFPGDRIEAHRPAEQGITQIANHNYDQRLDFGDDREFGEVAQSFNDMAARLDEYRRSSLDKLMTAKTRVEAIVNTLHEPIIGCGLVPQDPFS